MIDSVHQRGKADLLDIHEEEYGRLNHLLDTLTPEQHHTSGVAGPWSVKDIVAHLIFWNRFPITEVNNALRGFKIVDEAHDDDVINASQVAQHASWSFEDVRVEFDRSYDELMDFLHLLPEEAFTDRVLLERLGDTIDGAFANNTYEHWALHREQIERWLANGM